MRETEFLEDPGVNERIILRWIFRKWDVGVWTISIWRRIGTVGRHFLMCDILATHSLLLFPSHFPSHMSL